MSDVLTKPVMAVREVLHKAEGQAAARGQEERVQLVARENDDTGAMVTSVFSI